MGAAVVPLVHSHHRCHLPSIRPTPHPGQGTARGRHGKAGQGAFYRWRHSRRVRTRPLLVHVGPALPPGSRTPAPQPQGVLSRPLRCHVIVGHRAPGFCAVVRASRSRFTGSHLRVILGDCLCRSTAGAGGVTAARLGQSRPAPEGTASGSARPTVARARPSGVSRPLGKPVKLESTTPGHLPTEAFDRVST